MTKKIPFLHERDDFADLLRVVADRLSIEPVLVEKDYWLMHCLWGLQQPMGNEARLQFELKGGTSLSKGFRIIDRFSEDIDIRIEPPAELDVKAGKNQDKPAHVASRGRFYDWLAEIIRIPGIEAVQRDTEFDDAKLRSAGIRLIYPTRFASLAGVKPGILLELGFDDTAPNVPCTISSWAWDAAASSNVATIDNRAIDIPCYSPAYTLVEKLQTISTKFRLQQAHGGFPRNFLRHYYDVYCLLDDPSVQKFIGTPEYAKRKMQRFRAGDNLDIASNDAFALSDPATRTLFEAEYLKTAALYFKGQIPLADILERLRKNLSGL